VLRCEAEAEAAAEAAAGVYEVSRLLEQRRLGSARQARWLAHPHLPSPPLTQPPTPPRPAPRQFLVRWAPPYGPADDSWEDEANILNKRLIASFEAAHGPSVARAAALPAHAAAGGGESEAERREAAEAEQRWAALAVDSSRLWTGPQLPPAKAPRTSTTREVTAGATQPNDEACSDSDGGA